MTTKEKMITGLKMFNYLNNMRCELPNDLEDIKNNCE